MTRQHTLQIDYESEGFPTDGPVPNGPEQLETTWDELLWSAITVGRPNRHFVFRHGKASLYEAMFRLSLVRMSLEEMPLTNRFWRTQAAKTLDPTEKGAVSYFLGMTLCKLFSWRLLNAPWVMHLDVFRPQINEVLTGRSRPDLIGQTNSGDWVVLEAKGRVSVPSQDAKTKAKQQAMRAVSIDGLPPSLRIGGITFFQNDELQFYWVDPNSVSQNDTIKIKGTLLDDFWMYYYQPILGLIHLEEDSFSKMQRQLILTQVEGLDLKVGIHPEILGLLLEKQWSEARKACIELIKRFEHDEYFPDGVRVVAGDAWHWPFKELEE